MVQQFHSCVFVQKNWNQDLKGTLCTVMCLPVFFITAKRCKSKCPLIKGYIQKIRHIPTVYLSLKKKAANPIMGTMWKNHKDIMGREISQSQGECWVISLLSAIQNSHRRSFSQKQRVERGLPGVEEGRTHSHCSVSIAFQFCRKKKS